MTKRIGRRISLTLFAVAVVFALSGALTTRAAETVSIGGSKAVLLKPAAPVASVILMPGGDGRIAARPGGKIGIRNWILNTIISGSSRNSGNDLNVNCAASCS